MLRPSSWKALTLPLALAVLAGCDCGGAGVSRNLGDLGIIWRDASGERFVNRDAVYDFGAALVGQRKPLTLSVRNGGVGRLTLTTLTQTGGDEVAIGPSSGTATSSFEVAYVAATIEPSGLSEMAMYFTPKSLAGRFEATLELSSEGTRPEDSKALITLRGTAERGACEFPAVIDFGKVPVGETFPSVLPFTNPTAVAAEGFAGDPSGADAVNFGYAQSSPRDLLSVGANSTVDVTFTFTPTERRAYEAQVVVRGAGGCPDATVTLRGMGSDEVLSWTPTELVYGHVPPGREKVLEVVFTNPSNVPLTLTDLTSAAPGDFYVVAPVGTDATRLVVPGNNVPTPLKVACNPAALGVRDSRLTFNTPVQRVAMGVINLRCTGGGPAIRVTPQPTLNFGRVGYFANGTGFQRKVNVQNVGTRPPTPDPTANLFLGQVATDGTPGQVPLFEVRGANASEFTANLGSAYAPGNGLPAVPGANFVDVAVTFLPSGLGMKTAELVIYSNDPMKPEVTVALTANAVNLPPCDVTITPGAGLDFGLVTPPNTKDLPVTFRNNSSTDVCLISGLDLAAGTSTAYSLVNGAIAEKELMPNEVWSVVVRVAPPGPVPTALVTLTGQLAFDLVDPTTPRRLLPLTTRVGPACLAITPDPLDFGTVRLGCTSRAREVNLYNVCTTPVTVMGFTLPSAGGLPNGAPGCSMTGGCPEFFLTSTPAIPMDGLAIAAGAAPVTAQLRYTPVDTGSDTGALAVEVLQNGQAVTYLLGLQGNSDTTGVQTDTFTQSSQPKADILLVIDDSCSMGDKQAALAQNFASFIQYATATNTDYQIGVVTTSEESVPCFPPLPCPGVPGGGKLVKRGTVGPILTRQTPNVAQAFSTLVNVGTDGDATESGLATATLALTPPLIAAENAGFIRVDANLAVVVVSDAGDQSAQPVSYYQNRLLNVKGFNRLSMFTFSAIIPLAATPPMSGCSYDDTSGAPRYQAVVAYTSGVEDEICSANWAATLQNLGRTAFGYRTQFYLNNTPDLGTGQPQVSINGTPVAMSGYSYDTATNSIIFDPTTTPGAGETLTITYPTACNP